MKSTYLRLHVLERCRGHQAEADEEDVRLRVAERPQSVVVLLSGRVPQLKRHRRSIDNDLRRVWWMGKGVQEGCQYGLLRSDETPSGVRVNEARLD